MKSVDSKRIQSRHGVFRCPTARRTHEHRCKFEEQVQKEKSLTISGGRGDPSVTPRESMLFLYDRLVKYMGQDVGYINRQISVFTTQTLLGTYSLRRVTSPRLLSERHSQILQPLCIVHIGI